MPRAAGRHERLAAAAAAVEQCRARTHIAPEDVWATTAGTPGVVEDSAYLSVCHVVPDWSDFSLAQALGAHLPGPVQVENDANLSAIAERWRGVAHGVDSMVWVLTGRRIRAAILINGLLYRGANGAAGEIGWLPELGWAELSEQPLSFGGADGTRAGEAAATTIGRAAAGDEHSRMEIDRYAAGLAPGLTALTLALNPQCLVIGGAVAAVGDTLLRALAGHMGKHSLRLPELRTSALDRDAVGLGAVRHSLDQVEARLFSTDRSGARPTAVG